MVYFHNSLFGSNLVEILPWFTFIIPFLEQIWVEILPWFAVCHSACPLPHFTKWEWEGGGRIDAATKLKFEEKNQDREFH